MRPAARLAGWGGPQFALTRTPPARAMPASSPPTLFRFGPFELDAEARALRHGGDVIALRPRPFDLLRVLLESAGRLVSKDELLQRVWPGLIVEENNLQVQVSV